MTTKKSQQSKTVFVAAIWDDTIVETSDVERYREENLVFKRSC